ncbi:uncharacterized protein LOC121373073 [Gigantopelta aegis]|uniref:uncharacterized protein LOC121373073 n=1 Tax=Gigantopelta aegis TaxID=1735272 RepID=UPI001B88E56F|nr:uncharacterized protein LOC121373073 [Gigantopelta aegis]
MVCPLPPAIEAVIPSPPLEIVPPPPDIFPTSPMYSTIQISVNDKRAKEIASHSIKQDLHDKTLEWEKRIWISLPDIEEHKNHIVGEESSFHVFSNLQFFFIVTWNSYKNILHCFIFWFIQIGGVLQPVDESIRLKIRELVSDGVTSVQETKRHLDIFVAKDLFLNKIKPPKHQPQILPTHQ